jgi:hypothetical protein
MTQTQYSSVDMVGTGRGRFLRRDVVKRVANIRTQRNVSKKKDRQRTGSMMKTPLDLTQMVGKTMGGGGVFG